MIDTAVDKVVDMTDTAVDTVAVGTVALAVVVPDNFAHHH